MDILIFVAILVIIAGVGKKLFSYMLPNAQLPFLEGGVVNFAVGAGSIALLVLSIGLFGVLYRWVLIITLTVLGLFCRKEIVGIMKDAGRWFSGIFQKDFSILEKFILVMLLFVSLFTLIGSLSPILGMDSVTYHMYDAKVFIQQHRVSYIPYTRESLWPFLIQMLFVLGLCLKGVMVAKLFHFAFYIASVAAIYALCRRYWPRPNSILAAAVFSLVPAVFTSATYAYTDLAVVFYTVMSFYGFFAWLDTVSTRWFCFSGIMSGFLLGIKITSAVVPVAILLLYAHRVFLSLTGIKKKLFPPLIFISAMLAMCGVWYIRSWVILGNPIYPFAARLFGGVGYDILSPETMGGIGVGLPQYILLVWPLTLDPSRFGGESIGPLFLVFLLMLVFAKKQDRFFWYSFAIALCLYTSWFIVYQFTRFLYPTLVFLSILVAFVYYEILEDDSVLKKIGACVLVGSFSFSVALSVYHNADKLPLLLKMVTEREYLLQHERSYAVADYVNTHLPKDAKILVPEEPRLYYFERKMAMADLIWLDYLAGKHRKAGQTLEEYIQKAGYAEYLVDKTDLSKGRPTKSPAWVRDLFRGYTKTVLKQVEFKDRGEHYIYKIMRINGGVKGKK